MANYTLVGWQNEVTKLSAGNFAQMDAGIKDAAEHNKFGLKSARPPAAAASKNHIWRDETGASWYCDGTTWMPMERAVESTNRTVRIDAPANAAAGETLVASAGTIVRTAFYLGTAGSTFDVDELRLLAWRDANVTSGTIFFDLYLDDGTGKPAAAAAASFGSIAATNLSESYRPQAQLKFRINSPVTIPAGMRVYLVVRRSALTGGNIFLPTQSAPSGPNLRYEYSGTWDNAIAGHAAAQFNTHPAGFQVRNPSGVDLLNVDADGVTASGLISALSALPNNGLADVLKQYTSTRAYGPSIRFGQRFVAAAGSNILLSPDYPLTGLLLVHGLRAQDSANMSFAMMVVECDYYANNLNVIHNGTWQGGGASTFTISGTTGSAARSLLMQAPAAIGDCNVGLCFISFSGTQNVTFGV